LLEQRQDIRNLAIIAHVDHGKTTLVDSLLWQAGALRADQEAPALVLDSNELERERGITILAKNTSIHYNGVKINIVDTPGHADFGGEVERALAVVDGALLLVDAAEGPLPQTRFVVRKALEAALPMIVVVNKIDRSDARVASVVDEVYELFIDLGADDSQIEFPLLYCNGRAGRASRDYVPGGPEGQDLRPLFEAIIAHIPPPTYDPQLPLQALVANLDASPYLGRLAVCRVRSGTLRAGREVAWCRLDGRVERAPVRELFATEGLERQPVAEAGPGEIVAVAGIEEVMVGETLADPDDPRPLPPIAVEEPALSVTIGVNSSPLAGREGSRLTARQIKARLDAELVGNVSLRVRELEGEAVGAWEVQGRGELQLAILVEVMRREGFELTVGQPQVVERMVDGVRHEPVERLIIDVPEQHVGAVTQLLAGRKGRLEQIVNHGSGWVRIDYLIPTRGLIGLRRELLSETRGTAVLNHTFERFEPHAGELRRRSGGALVADRAGKTTQYALSSLQERGTLFVGPGEEVYEGMVIGEHVRPGDLDVNPCREKHLTNMRSSTGEVLERPIPFRKPTLDEALEFIDADECVEVTPESVRIRKAALDKVARQKEARRRAPARR